MTTSKIFSNLELTQIKTKGKSKMLAHGKVIIGGAVEIKFTVYDGKHGVWPKWPVQKGEKKNDAGFPIEYPQVKLASDELKQEFETMIKTAYVNLLEGNHSPSHNSGEEAQPGFDDGIPF